MAYRFLLLPYETYNNPNYLPGVLLYRPKYRGEIDYDGFETVASAPDREVKGGFVLIRFRPAETEELEEKQAQWIAQLLAKPDVEELQPDEQVAPAKLARVRAITKDLPIARSDTGAALSESIKSSVRARRADGARRQ